MSDILSRKYEEVCSIPRIDINNNAICEDRMTKIDENTKPTISEIFVEYENVKKSSLN